MIDERLDRMRDIVQHDVGNRGLCTDPQRNLVSETLGDFRAACHSLAEHPSPGLAVVTGFFIPTANPPAAETDGPLGAVFLARALVPLGIRVAIAADANCTAALHAGLAACGLQERVMVVALPSPAEAQTMAPDGYLAVFRKQTADLGLTHLLTTERVGPSHTPASVQHPKFIAAVAPAHWDRCHTMRGRDITDQTSPAHWLFEGFRHQGGVPSIGIGDGGNEIGMGKLPWDVIRHNIPAGGLVACRVPVDHLIVAGVSNWGTYALAAGVHLLRGVPPPAGLFDANRERHILEVMVAAGPLVDGVLGKPSATVDGLTWEQYSAVLPQLRQAMEARS
jgi:hypothetical protein